MIAVIYARTGKAPARLTVLALLFLTIGCAPNVVRGEFVGSTYVNKTAGYAFTVPKGWQPDSLYLEQLKRQTQVPSARMIEFALRRRDSSLILGTATRQGAGTSIEPFGSPRSITGTDKVLLLRELFPELPVPEYEKLVTQVGQFGPNTFILVTGPGVCTLSERAAVITTNRAWNRFAVTHASGYTYIFIGNICDPDAGGSFEELLASVRLLK